MKGLFLEVLLMLLLMAMFPLSFNIKPVKSTWTGTVYIRADGSIDPPDAPIVTFDNITYTLTDNITSTADGIVVEKNDVIINGADYVIQKQNSPEPESYSYRGIVLVGRFNVTIENITIKNFCYGIFIHSSAYINIAKSNVIEENIAVDYPYSIYPIYLYGSSNCNIFENNIKGEKIGYTWDYCAIYLDQSSNNLIKNNNVTGININAGRRLEGISLSESSNNVIHGNRLINTDFCNYFSSNNNITQNYITFTDGVSYTGFYLFYSSNNSVIGNKLFKTGMWVFNSYENFVENNTVNYKPIVYFEGVSDFVVKETGQVILVRCNNITIESLNLSYTSFGIQLWETNYSKIRYNNLTNNVFGIQLDGKSCNNIISKNNIRSNSYAGIELFGGFGSCEYNNITENNIENNELGLWIRFSSNNRIYNNNFINNVCQLWINYGESITSDAVNVWDAGYPSGGNYWSDYIGVDLYSGPYQNETGSDGIGDTPYVINENNTDRYPLMGPFGGLTFKGQNVTAYPSSEVCLIFENVTSEGETSVNVTNVGPEPPSGFMLAGNYYDIKTTANYSGTINLRIVYDDSNMTLEEEMNLRFMQWDEALQKWIDITTYVDIENNVVVGETTHLSIFALFTTALAPTPPVQAPSKCSYPNLYVGEY